MPCQSPCESPWFAVHGLHGAVCSRRSRKSVRIPIMAATAIPVEMLPSIDPATGKVLAHIGRTPPEMVGRTVVLARAAQKEWAKVPVRERCRRLRKLRECLMASRNELADAVVGESGKPRVEAVFADIFVALDSAEYWSKKAPAALRRERVPHHSSAAKAKSGHLVYEPLGVIGIISSWNYPLAIPMSQIIPAVAAGNAVVSKPSDFTPRCGELIERLFVEEAVSQRFAELCVQKTKKLHLGPGSDPATDVGPLIRPQHVRRMSDVIEDAVARGARVLCGGNPRPDLGPNFFEPTVVTDVDSSMNLFQEETFGPILAMQTVKGAEEAIRHANDSPFALAASVWTKDAKKGHSIAERIRAGAVMV